MPLVGASPIYRPPVAGEPIRLREDGHWSTDGLVGYWPMREMRGGIVQDMSRFGHHGSTSGVWQGGDESGAVAKLTKGDYITLPATALAVGLSDFTITCGYYLQKLPSWGPLCETRNPDGLGIQAHGTAKQRMFVYFGTIGFYIPTAGEPWTLNEWHRLSIAFHRSTYAIAYWRGNEIGRVSIASQVVYAFAPTVAMSWLQETTTGYHTYGRVSDIGIHSRALSAAEIRALHAAPDLPMWRPRAGVSMAGLAVPTGRPRPFTQHRHGPRLVIGGST